APLGIDPRLDQRADGENSIGYAAHVQIMASPVGLRVVDGKYAVSAPQLARVADLATAFSVEGGLVEDDGSRRAGVQVFDRLALGVAQGYDSAGRGGRLVAVEDRRRCVAGRCA